MKLTKAEIKFIDHYLIKNEVKWWDVRMELLDHIVSAVEDKITNKGISFNEALLDVHRGFGNQLITFSIPKKDLFKEGLYQANNGFKKFMRHKQKEIGRQQRKEVFNVLKSLVLKPQFWLEYLLLLIFIVGVFTYSHKASLGFSFFLLFIPLVSTFKYAFKKELRYSIAGNMIFIYSTLVPQMILLPLNIWKEEIKTNPNLYYAIFIGLIFLFYPIARAESIHFTKKAKAIIERHKLLNS